MPKTNSLNGGLGAASGAEPGPAVAASARDATLRWRKLSDGVWMDSRAHYCIRVRRHTDDSSCRRMQAPVFDVWAMYPDTLVERIDTSGALTAAKQSAGRDWDAVDAELGAFGPAPND